MSERAKSLVEPVLAAQHDLITSAQAGEVGVHRSTVHRLHRAGHLERAEPRVYRRVGSHPSWEQGVLAVLLRLGPPAVASHRAVARSIFSSTHGCPSRCASTWSISREEVISGSTSPTSR